MPLRLVTVLPVNEVLFGKTISGSITTTTEIEAKLGPMRFDGYYHTHTIIDQQPELILRAYGQLRPIDSLCGQILRIIFILKREADETIKTGTAIVPRI